MSFGPITAPAENTTEHGLMVILGVELVLMVSTGVWWILLVGCKNAQTHYKEEFVMDGF